MELKKYKLGDIAKIEISGVDKKSVDGETPVRLCNFVDVYRNWAITQKLSENFMIASAKETEIAKCSIHKGKVAITKDSETRDDIGIPAYIADDFDNVLLGYHCALITPNDDVLDGKYLNAFMHTRYIQKYFENNASGSGQRYTLSNETIFQIPILLPSLEVQKAIGNLLSNIDRKIELNRQINDNLAVGNWYADDTDKTDELGLKFPFGMQVIFQTRMTRITRILKAALCLLHLIRMEKKRSVSSASSASEKLLACRRENLLQRYAAKLSFIARLS